MNSKFNMDVHVYRDLKKILPRKTLLNLVTVFYCVLHVTSSYQGHIDIFSPFIIMNSHFTFYNVLINNLRPKKISLAG